jgi:hypothetical protein
MILVRNCFTAKPGHAGKLAALFRDTAIPAITEAGLVKSARVLTDVTGDFNRVVFEYELENLAGVDAMMHAYATRFGDLMKGYTDHWITGTREIFRIS